MALPSLTLLGQSILSGVFIGALYGLRGRGLSLSWGMLRQVNLAHFGLAFLGGYLPFQLAGRLAPFVTLALTVPLFFLAGVALHWFLSRYAPDMLNTLLVTFGLTTIIEAGIQWIWTADFQRMESAYGAMRWKVGAFYIPFPELVTLLLAMLLCGTMWALLRFTDFGRAARAMTEDPAMAAAFGVNEKRLRYVISVLAAPYAAVAGMCLALTHTLAPVQIYAWMGVVFAGVMIGGLGSAIGPLLAGLLIGVSEALTMAVTAPTWAPLVSFTLLIAIILLPPG